MPLVEVTGPYAASNLHLKHRECRLLYEFLRLAGACVAPPPVIPRLTDMDKLPQEHTDATVPDLYTECGFYLRTAKALFQRTNGTALDSTGQRIFYQHEAFSSPEALLDKIRKEENEIPTIAPLLRVL